MKKNILSLTIICIIISLQACKKENSEVTQGKTLNKSSVENVSGETTYVKAITPFSASVIGGDTFAVTVVLNQPAPSGGFQAYVKTVRLTGPIVDVPSYVTIPQGQTTGTIIVHTIPVRVTEIELFLVGPSYNILDLQYFIRILPRLKNDPRPPIQFLEAENAVLKGTHAVFGGEPYFSNGGFAEYDKTNGGSVTFNFSVKKTNNYFIVLKYATPSKYNLKTVVMQIELNGKKVNTNFPFTANETATQILNTIQLLNNGNNTVKITSIGKGVERLDYLEVAAQ